MKFTNIAPNSGIKTDYSIISSNWVDYNNDGLPDLWVTPHGYYVGQYKARLYINQGDGTFVDIYSQVFPQNIPRVPGNDTHGGSWADYDNDGDKDLLLLTGAGRGVGSQPSLFFVNNNGTLTEKAIPMGLSYAIGRGRSPLWFDWNSDGKLDVLQVNQSRDDTKGATALFEQTDDGFTKVATFPKGRRNNWSAQITDLYGDGTKDILINNWEEYKVYENKPSSMIDISYKFPQTKNIVNQAIADFDGDLVPDVFFTRTSNTNYFSTTFKMAADAVYARLTVDSGAQGISFQTTGNVTFDFRRLLSLVRTNRIFIGAEGHNPSQHNFTLSSDSGSIALGIMNPTAKSQQGLYIGYRVENQTWQAILYEGPPGQKKNQKTIITADEDNSGSLELQMLVDSTQKITNLSPLNFKPPKVNDYGVKPFFITYNKATDQYVDKTAAAGFNEKTFAKNVVAGDFDNDMDVDLFTTNGSSSSLPNVLYENQGDGTFIKVPNAGGAQVKSPFATYQEPILESFIANSNVGVADYNVDGFLDIFVAGSYFETTKIRYPGNPTQLYQNTPNGNKWLEIDLQGVVSNRDAIGAKVYVTAGGVTQLREQSGGMHGFSQDFTRLHFGLGSNKVVDEIEIRWPSGAVQTLKKIAANQLLKIEESAEAIGTSKSDSLKGGAGNDTINGLGGNDTISGFNGDDYLDGGVGKDSLLGGSSNDIYFIDNIADHIKENPSAGIDQVNSSIDYVLPDNIENLTLIGNEKIKGNGNQLANAIVGNNFDNIINGQQGNDSLTGAQGNDNLSGNQGNDSLKGSEGNDSLYGGLGKDSMIGGNGSDIYLVDNIGDVITEDADSGTDIVNSQINYTLTDNVEKLILIGTDSINGGGNELNNIIIGNGVNNLLRGEEGDDSLSGLDGNDNLFGNLGNDSLIGEKGNDSLDGGEGQDSLLGGNGNDTYFVDDLADQILENRNAGTDTINSLVSRSLGSNEENLILLGTNPISGSGNSLNNKIIGNNTNNIITSKQGNDTINGLDGNDNLFGNEGNDYLDGGNGQDSLIGSDGKDTLIGGFGNDKLTAIGGEDLLVGGKGSDQFIYNTNSSFNRTKVGIHKIKDFVSHLDQIVLDKTTFSTIKSNIGKGFSVASEFATVKSDSAAAKSKALIVYCKGSGKLFYNLNRETNGYGIGGQIATLTNNVNLVANDFIIQT